MRILVVDDEKLLVKGIKFNLENEGYTVDACYDGETAVELARKGDYDLIILDLMMPKKDGLRPARRYGAFPPCPSSCSPPAARMRTCFWALSPGRTTM